MEVGSLRKWLMARRRHIADRTPAVASSARLTTSRSRIIVFGIVFSVLVALGSVSELFMRRNHIGATYQVAIATVVAGSLRLTGASARVEHTKIHVGSSEVEVTLECTGVKASAIFCAAVLAFPCPWRARLIGLLAGVLGVGLLNLLRILTLAAVAGYRNEWFDSLHALLMQGFLVLFVAPLWIVWMVWVIRPTPTAGIENNPE